MKWKSYIYGCLGARLAVLPAERTARTPMVKKLAAVLCISVLAVGAILRSEGDKAKAAIPAAAPPPVPVAVAEVQQGDVPIELSGVGQVQAFNEATIRPQVSGQITSIDYSEGQLVQKGARLVANEPRPYQAR